MTQTPKVVPLKASEASGARITGKLPPILHTVRQTARRNLSELINTLFNNVDDVLFEMADRSRNDADQHLYFDSMRDIRVHRKRITTEFGQQLYARFDQLFETTDADDAVDFDTAVDSLSLVQNDELEVAVAVAGIVSKVTSRFSLQIMQLTRRIDAVCPDRTVTERLNPLGPYQLGDAFVAATEKLAIEIRVRIVLLKLFERFVMEHLGHCYEQANRLLAEAGVLPDLRDVMRRQVHARSTERAPHTATSTQPTSTTPTAVADGPSGTTEFSVLQQLLAAQPGTPGAGGGSGYAVGTGSVGPLITTPQLMTVLTAAQTDARAQPIDIEHAPLTVDLRQLVLTQAARSSGNVDGSLGRTDDDTVNLVAMLFDYILNDRNLAIPMKALIGRLQIPMLKVAILDKTFFSKTSHPARQLLNELSSAGIGWSSSVELKRDALYNKIESVVLRVLNDFSEDLTLFTKLVAELRKFVQQDHHRVQIVEQRVKEVEAGRAKAAAAKQIVERLINQKASGLRLPPDIGRFISDTWSRVLVYLCVRNGSEGPDWSDAVQTFDDLLWAMQPLDELAAVDQRDRDRPGLLCRLEDGMELIGLAGSEIETALAMLGRRLTEIADSDRAFLADDRQPVEAPVVAIMEEIVLTTPTEARELEDVEPEPEMVREINRLTEGVWIEITHDDGEKTRCKLAAVVKPGNRYVFVNRRGMKVAERTRMALAVELKRRSIVILDESQVFDRALAAVIGNLRQLQRQPG